MAKVQLFGVGVRSLSPVVTAQERINCYVEPRMEEEKTKYVLIRRPGLRLWKQFATDGGIRALHIMDNLPTPLLFICASNRLYFQDAAGVLRIAGTLNTTNGFVYMADDGQRLMLVDGANGYSYTVATDTFELITSGNFTTHPGHVAWQDTYFFATDNSTAQFQLSDQSTATVWPAQNIAFAQSFPGHLVGCISYKSQMAIFADYFTEYWQDTGAPSFPYARIPGAMQEFGLVSPSTLVRLEDTIFGLFQSRSGGIEASYLNGYQRQKVSNTDIDVILNNQNPTSGAGAFGFGVRFNGHPFYGITITSINRTLVYDGLSQIWSEWKTFNGAFRGTAILRFGTDFIVPDFGNGNIYIFDDNTFTDGGDPMPMEITTRHIWNDDKYIGINRIEIDVQSGTGPDIIFGSGGEFPEVPSFPSLELLVSKDGGNSFRSVGYRSVGKVGEYTQRVYWTALGAARDWVLRLRCSDPMKMVITGATAEIEGGPF